MSDEEEAFGMWWWEQELEEEEREKKKHEQRVWKQLNRRRQHGSTCVNIIKFGLQHPKWYVKLYAVFCLFWEILCGITALILLVTVPGALLIFVPFFMVPPLLPLWYLRRRSEAKALAEKVAWETEVRKKREAFVREQRAKGLVSFIDRHGVERWGTPKQVEEWKRIDVGLKNNFVDYSPREFEYFIGELFRRMGYLVEIGKYAKDFGIDLIAKREGEVVVVEIKKWQIGHNVGPETIRSVLGAMWKAKANKAIVVTTSDFTVLAEEQAREAPVELWNGRVLCKLVEKYFITAKTTSYKNFNWVDRNIELL